MCSKQVRQCPEWAISCERDVKRVDHKLGADSDDCPHNIVARASGELSELTFDKNTIGVCFECDNNYVIRVNRKSAMLLCNIIG